MVMFLFQMVFMDTAATIVTGAAAERWKFAAFAISSVVLGRDHLPALWQLGMGRRLAVATRRQLRPRPRLLRLRRLGRGARGRRLDALAVSMIIGAANRQVQRATAQPNANARA